MSDVATVLLLTTLAGGAIPLGALLACIERIRPDWLEQELRHSVIAFGGGVLLAAVALVLVPEGTKHAPIAISTAALAAGGIAFFAVDRLLERRGTPASQLIATLLDFLPEAMALGAAFARGGSVGLLLALLIALQNLPEGFNAYREMRAGGGLRGSTVLGFFAALVPLGPIAGLTGLWWLADHPVALGVVMLVGAGGILYLTFQDIAPQARLERHWAPPLGAVAGFLLGMLGHLLLVGH